MTSKTKESGTSGTSKVYQPNELEAALYNATDILGRCMLPYVVLKDTAYDIVKGPEKLGISKGVYLGVEKRYMTPEVWSSLRTFSAHDKSGFISMMDDYKETPKGFEWKFQGVPIYVQVIKRNYKFIRNPDFKFFRLEEYRIPNPFDNYWKARMFVV